MGGSSLNFSVLGRVRLLVKNYSVSIFLLLILYAVAVADVSTGLNFHSTVLLAL